MGNIRTLIGAKTESSPKYKTTEHVNELERKFKAKKIENTSECEEYFPFIASELGFGEIFGLSTEVIEVSPGDKEKLNYCGPASLKKIKSNIDDMLERLDSEDHILLNFTAHGKFEQNSFSLYISEFEWFEESHFKQLFQKIKEKGIHTQYFSVSCYGGNALKLMNKIFDENETDQSKLCGVTLSDHESVSLMRVENTPFIFGKLSDFPSTLKSFSCYMAEDKINPSMSSLDYLVDDWFQNNPIFDTKISCQEKPYISQLYNSGFSNLFDLNSYLLRKNLYEQFQESVLAPYNKCLPEDVQKTAQEDSNYSSNMYMCIKEFSKIFQDLQDLDAQKAYYAVSGGFFGRSKKLLHDGLTFSDRKIYKHLLFLQNADQKDLLRYQSLMCCLDYNPFTKTYPSMCL